jgi:tRNA (adenine58-N1)-methyltransferase non-catalytic subunit
VGSFPASDLIQQPYGLAYEIVDKRLKVMPPRTLQEVGRTLRLLLSEWPELMLFIEDTDATNELINDGQFVQPLTLEEIEALKQSGVHASVSICLPPMLLHG